MDPTRSDTLTHVLATPTPRRQALKVLTATAVGVPLALSAGGVAVASRQHRRPFQRADSGSDSADQIVAIARDAMKQNDLRAVILGVWIDNKNVVTTALGQSMTGVPATTAMHFRNGSIAIAYLTTLLLQLVDQRRIRLDDRLSTWLPSLPHAQSITLRMLAESRSGYADYVQSPAFLKALQADPFREWSQQELVQLGVSQPLLYPPGTRFSYAHTNFVILGMVLQRVTGKPVARLMHEHFLAPLGLHDTESPSTPDIQPPVLHAFTSERGRYEESTFWNPSWALARGAIMTTNIHDVLKSAIAVGTGTLLSRASHSEQITPVSLISSPGRPKVYYGMGIFVANTWLLQNPLYSGYNALMAYLPSRKIAIAVTTTFGEKSSPSTNYSTQIYHSIATYLAPDHRPW
jgi:CubicO group peptidase (beta-lactamase class C family)